MPQQVVYSKSFSKQKYDIKDNKGICKKAKHSGR